MAEAGIPVVDLSKVDYERDRAREHCTNARRWAFVAGGLFVAASVLVAVLPIQQGVWPLMLFAGVFGHAIGRWRTAGDWQLSLERLDPDRVLPTRSGE